LLEEKIFGSAWRHLVGAAKINLRNAYLNAERLTRKANFGNDVSRVQSNA
jgi:hypothetical protein